MYRCRRNQQSKALLLVGGGEGGKERRLGAYSYCTTYWNRAASPSSCSVWLLTALYLFHFVSTERDGREEMTSSSIIWSQQRLRYRAVDQPSQHPAAHRRLKIGIRFGELPAIPPDILVIPPPPPSESIFTSLLHLLLTPLPMPLFILLPTLRAAVFSCNPRTCTAVKCFKSVIKN